MSTREKRKHPRSNAKWQVNYHVLDNEQLQNESIQQYSTDISRGGVGFVSERAVDLKTMVVLKLISDESPSGLLALAKVVGCRYKRGRYEIGAEFWWIGPEHDESPMAKYVASITQSSAAPSAGSSKVVTGSLRMLEASSSGYTSNTAKGKQSDYLVE